MDFRRIIGAAAALLLGVQLTGCSGSLPQDDGKLQVVCTLYPAYDWAREITRGHEDTTELRYLLDNGIDMHNYQPSAQDMVRIADCDVLIYVGGESERWMEAALKEKSNPGRQVICLLDSMGDAAVEEELAEGMQPEEEEEEEEEEGPEYDEHVWLSLRSAGVLVPQISEALCMADPEHAQDYRDNAQAYGDALAALDAEYAKAVAGAQERTVLFADRFPFRYLTQDYGLTYYAAFPGCSAESEASFETVSFLSEKVDALGLPAVFTIENSDGSVARAVLDNSQHPDLPVLTLDSMQSVSRAQIESDVTYYDVMTQNLEVLRQGLR